KIAWRSDHHAPHLADTRRNHRGVGEVTYSKRDVYALINQVDRPVDEQKPHGHRWVSVQKRLDRRQKELFTQEYAGRQRKRAAWHRALSRDDGIGLLELGEHAPARSDIALPLLAQLNRPRRSIQQFAASPLFEEGNRAADRGGRAAKLAPCGCETPLVDRDDKHFHCIEAIHAIPQAEDPWVEKLPTPLRCDNRRAHISRSPSGRSRRNVRGRGGGRHQVPPWVLPRAYRIIHRIRIAGELVFAERRRPILMRGRLDPPRPPCMAPADRRATKKLG